MISGARWIVWSPSIMPSATRAPMRIICGPSEQVNTFGGGDSSQLVSYGIVTWYSSPA